MALKDGALRFVVFLGTVRDGNFGQRAAKFIVRKLEARGHQTTLLGTSLSLYSSPSLSSLSLSLSQHCRGTYGSLGRSPSLLLQLFPPTHTHTHTDPEVLDLPLLKKPLHFYKDRSEAPQVLRDTNKAIVDADAFVIISAEYNHSMPPALTNMLDHFPVASYKYRPSGIVCYSMGPFGGVRAAMQCRMLLGELSTPSVGPLFAIPQINKALSETGDPLNDRMDSGAEKLIKELEWYGLALKRHRETAGLPQ